MANCGVRVRDVRVVASLAFQRMQLAYLKKSCGLKILLAPFYVIAVYAFMIFFVAFALPTLLFEALTFLPMRLCGQLCCGVPCCPLHAGPLRGFGAAARNEAHVARRSALLDSFAKAHGLVLSYECVDYAGWQQGDKNSPSLWVRRRSAALRVRLATGSLAGFVHGDDMV